MFASGAGFNRMGAGIKSIQTGTIDLNSLTTNTATITSVDVNNSILLYGNFSWGASGLGPPNIYPYLSLTNATTVTATRQASIGTTFLVSFTVIEFNTGVIKSVQRGTITLNNVLTNTATITSVDTTKSAVFWLGESLNSAGNNDTGFNARLTLTNATTVTATMGTTIAQNNVVSYQVVEFN